MTLEREILGKMECGDCGKPVTVKVNKNGLAYYNCFNGLDHKEGYCGASHKWSVDGTARKRREFARQKTNDEFEERKAKAKAKRDDPPPSPPPSNSEPETNFLGS